MAGRPVPRWLVLCPVLCFCTAVGACEGHAATLERLIVKFRPNAISFPSGQKVASLATMSGSSSMLSFLDSTGVDTLEKVFNFEQSDTVKTSMTGESVALIDLSRIAAITFANAPDSAAILGAFAARSDVLYAEAPVQAFAAVVPSDPLFGQQWGLEQGSGVDIDAATAWDVEAGSPTVKLAIIDSGIDYGHSDLGDGFGTGSKIIGGYDYVRGSGDPSDENWHGTAVAGVAAALTHNKHSGSYEGIAGIAGGWGYDDVAGTGNRGVSVYAQKVLDENARTDDVSNIATALWDAAAAGCRVMNVSISQGTQWSLAEAEAFHNAARMGAVITVANGNDNSSGGVFPASFESGWLLSVGATNAVGGRASSADWGSGGSNLGNITHTLDVVAPGTGVWTTTPRYVTADMQTDGRSADYDDVNGTSIAAPHVAGIAALLISRKSTLRGDDVKGIIKSTTVDLGAAGYDHETGWGQANASMALASIGGDRLASHVNAT